MPKDVDLTKPVWFYDDRSKDDTVLVMDTILWQNDSFVLCTAVAKDTKEPSDPNEPILFGLDGNVLNSEFMFWYATNDITWMTK